MWTWLQKLFGSSHAETEQAPDVHLKATSQTALARALHRLNSGQRGWVTIAEAGPLFSADETKRRIALIESRLGVRLFERKAGVLTPTDPGRIFVLRAESIELNLEAVTDKATSARQA